MVVALSTAGTSVAQTSPEESAATERPGTWRGSGAALGARVYLNTEPRLLPVDDMLTLHIPDVATEWNWTGDANARASSIFPGQTVVGLPDLLATFGVPMINEILPPYPATAFASPTSPDGTTLDGSARARIDPDGSFIDAEGNATVAGSTDALAPMVSLGPAVAHSRQSFVDGALVSRATSDIADVSVLGGLVTIGGVDVAVTASAGETGTPTAESTVSLGNVAILGVPVGVGPDGIEVGGIVIPPGGFPDGFEPAGIAGVLNEAITAFELRVQALDGIESIEGQTAEATSNGVLIEARIPVDGPLLPSIPLNQLPVNPNDLLAGVLPLPLPDLDANVIYREYVVSVVIGEARAAVSAGAGLGGEGLPDVGDAVAPPTTPAEESGPQDAGPSEVTPGEAADAGPDGTDRESAPVALPAASRTASLVLLADQLEVALALVALIGMVGFVAARASTASLRTTTRVGPHQETTS